MPMTATARLIWRHHPPSRKSDDCRRPLVPRSGFARGSPSPGGGRCRPWRPEGLPWTRGHPGAAGRILRHRLVADDRASRCAAALDVTGLLRRAFHGTVRAEHAAIPRFRLQQYAAAFALVEILARVRGHAFDLRMRTGRTCDH